jgi:putative transposase
MNKFNLEIGIVYEWHNGHIKIVRFVNNTAIVQRENGELQAIVISELVQGNPIPLELKPQLNLTPEPLFEKVVKPEALKKAHELQNHMDIMLHGLTTDDPNEVVDERYDISITTLTARVKAKAEELGWKLRVMWLFKKRYEKSGLMGLVDGRALLDTRAKRLMDDDPLLVSIKTVLNRFRDDSAMTRKTILIKVKDHIKREHGGKVKIPSDSTMYRYIVALQKELGLHGTPRQNQKRALTPKKVFGQFRATRPGQCIIIDATILDVFALDIRQIHKSDPKSSWTRLELVLAIDVYSRSIVGWRFVPVGAKAIDAALMLYDILHPKLMLPDWADITKWNYFGVPDEIWFAAYLDDPEEAKKIVTGKKKIAGIPFVAPTSVLIDNGRIFLSSTLRSACAKLGIQVQLARRNRATDKSPIERMFRYVKEHFSEFLKGYKGGDVPSRGINAEGKAFYFIDEIDAMFSEWVATDYQNHIPDNLSIPGVPNFRVSPNDKYAEGLAKAGFLPIPSLSYFDCLVTEYRKVTVNGIQVNYLYYDSYDIEPFKGVPSNITSGDKKGQYPIKVDSRDLSKIYFWDVSDDTWIIVPWRGASLFPQPFSEISLGFAKALVTERLYKTEAEQGDYARALTEMYARWDDNQFASTRERRAFGRSKSLTAEAVKDQATKSKAKFKEPPQLEELIEEVENMPKSIRTRVERFEQSRSAYEFGTDHREDHEEDYIDIQDET